MGCGMELDMGWTWTGLKARLLEARNGLEAETDGADLICPPLHWYLAAPQLLRIICFISLGQNYEICTLRWDKKVPTK